MGDEELDDVNPEPCQEDLEAYYRGDTKLKEYYEPDAEDVPDERKEIVSRRKLSQGSQILDRIPPHNLNVERAILGIYLIHPEKRGKHDRKLKDCFYYDSHEKIHNVMVGLKHLDLLLLRAELRRQGDLEWIGGNAYLSELYKIGGTTNPNHLPDYIKIVREYALRRKVIHSLTNGFRAAYYDEEDIGDCIERLVSELKVMRKKS